MERQKKEEKMMVKGKQFVFSARTTERGLKTLNELKGKLNISWDEMVIDAVCTRYDLDKDMMTLTKREKPAKEATPQQPPEDRSTEAKGLKPSEEKHATKQGAEKTKKKSKKG